jgi:hypothetical protein
VAEVAFGKIHGVTARAKSSHPLSTFAAEFDTRRILVSTSRAFHGKLLSKAAELKMRTPISSLLVGSHKNRVLTSLWLIGGQYAVTTGITILNQRNKQEQIECQLQWK